LLAGGHEEEGGEGDWRLEIGDWRKSSRYLRPLKLFAGILPLP
jgi:hypothetical protein